MKGLKTLGEYVLEFVIVVLLSILSVLSIVGFIPMLVGLCGYFTNKKDVRLFKDIFLTIKENWKIIIPYTIFQLIMIVVPILNIYYINTHPESLNGVMLFVSYVALVVGGIYLCTAPTIIVHMNVTFTQLLKNGIMLLFGSPIKSLISLAIVMGSLLSIVYAPYITIPLLYFSPLLITRLIKENYLVLKAKAMKSNPYELRKKEEMDDYLDENGKINHDKQD